MAIVLNDRVKETTTTSGTNNFILGGSVLGFQAFSTIGNGSQTYYACADQTGGNWEVGIGTYTLSTNTLSRDTILSSSNGGAKVVFGTGAKDIFITYPSKRALYADASNNISLSGTFSGTLSGTGAFTTLSASSTVSGAGFSTYLAAPPAIGGTAPAAGSFTSVTDTGLTSGRVTFASTGGLLADNASLTFDGTTLSATKFAGALNGTVGATTPNTGAFTTLSASGAVTLSGGTANGVGYLNASKVFTTGSALTYNGATLGVKAGNGNQLVLDNASEQYTLIEYKNNGTSKAQSYWDNTNTLFEQYVGVSSGFGFTWKASATELMRLTNTGLGIGTSSPAKKLDVNGDALINGITVGRGSGAISTNTASGAGALYSNTTGFENTASGVNALYSNTTGYNNTASGRSAIFSNTTGYNNTASGRSVLLSNTIGYNNTASGAQALYSNTTGSENTASGVNALYSNTSSVATLGTVVSGSGYVDGTYTNVQSSLSSGSTATTYPTLTVTVVGGAVTAVTLGTTVGAGFKDTTTVLTVSNTLLGGAGSGFTVAVASLSSGNYNTAVGNDALRFNTTGSNNTAQGLSALRSNTTGYQNTANGREALYSNTTGANNIAIGYNAGSALTTGSNNTIIGSIAGTAGLSDTVIIGAGTAERLRIDSSANFLLGGTSTPTSAAKCLVIYNGTAPTGNIAGGILYVESGALKYRGSSGTVTTLAVA